jgi:hypothetical protein
MPPACGRGEGLNGRPIRGAGAACSRPLAGCNRSSNRVFGWRVRGAEPSQPSFWGRLQALLSLVHVLGWG